MNPRYPFGVYTISNRARSASYATSPNAATFQLACVYYSICWDLSSIIFAFFRLYQFRKKQLTFFYVPYIIMELDKCIFASVAQSVVHLTRNEKVACSSQVTSSKQDRSLDRSCLQIKGIRLAVITQNRKIVGMPSSAWK